MSSAVSDLESQEAFIRSHTESAARQLRSSELEYIKLLHILKPKFSHQMFSKLENAVVPGVSNRMLQLDKLMSFHRLNPIARLIEEMLLLTAWNITKECLEVTVKHNGQFSLDGVGDPSGHRAEGLSLIRVQVREKTTSCEA